jgi:hypothetical protein
MSTGGFADFALYSHRPLLLGPNFGGSHAGLPKPAEGILSVIEMFRQLTPRPFDLQCRVSSHGVSYGVQEGRIAFRENFSLEVRESRLSLRI